MSKMWGSEAGKPMSFKSDGSRAYVAALQKFTPMHTPVTCSVVW